MALSDCAPSRRVIYLIALSSHCTLNAELEAARQLVQNAKLRIERIEGGEAGEDDEIEESDKEDDEGSNSEDHGFVLGQQSEL